MNTAKTITHNTQIGVNTIVLAAKSPETENSAANGWGSPHNVRPTAGAKAQHRQPARAPAPKRAKRWPDS